jgi:hypothetical protein
MPVSSPSASNALGSTYAAHEPLSRYLSQGLFDDLGTTTDPYKRASDTALLTILADFAGWRGPSNPIQDVRQNTTAYDAAIRRENMQRMREQFDALARQANRADFAVSVFPLVEYIRHTLNRIADSPKEGNTREILRRIRDSLIDGGWSQYKEQRARSTAMAILKYLSEAEVVTPQDVVKCAGQMRSAEIRFTGIPTFDFDEERDDFDGEKYDEEVSD